MNTNFDKEKIEKEIKETIGNLIEKNIWNKAGASFLFKKISDEWKIIYYHESALPPAAQ